MSERPRPQIEQKDDREPFVIRGHHLELYADLARDMSPSRASRVLLQAVMDIRNTPPSSQHMRYAYDVMGQTPQQATQFEEGAKKVFEDFLKLDSEAPVYLVDHQKDEICNTCVVGKHCETKNLKRFTKRGGVSQGDLGSIKEFLRFAKKDDYQTTSEPVHYRDADPEKRLKIKTTAGVIMGFLYKKAELDSSAPKAK
jgi:hypothetical protein